MVLQVGSRHFLQKSAYELPSYLSLSPLHRMKTYELLSFALTPWPSFGQQKKLAAEKEETIGSSFLEEEVT
jgi:hypothetical protein